MAARAALILALLHSLLSLAAAQQPVNVAQGKPAIAHTEYGNFYIARSVTDGNLVWQNRLPHCFLSHNNVPDNWLRVYLGDVFPMQNIRVFYRSGYEKNFVGTQISILNSTDGPPQLCTTVINSSLDYFPCRTGNSSCPKSANFSCPQSGNIVELRKDGGTLNICEVQVFVCPANTYGPPCTACGQCQGGAACASTDGSCPAGCVLGWKGQRCDTAACSAGQFGPNCSNKCGSCRDNAVCDHVTGNCPAGCQAGWEGPRCLQECREGTYGEGCTLQCGKCAGGQASCDKEDGTCRAGCQEGFEGTLCKERAERAKRAPAPPVDIIAGGLALAVMVLLLVLLYLFLLRRRRRQKDPGGGRDRSQRVTNNRRPPSTIEDGERHDRPAVKARKSQEIPLSDLGGDVTMESRASPYCNEGSTPSRGVRGGVPVAKFEDHVRKMKAEEKFKPEFESVSSKLLKPCEISQLPEHAGKNKYKTFYPYDDNRVVLEPTAGDPNSHYINASHVNGFELLNAFIAAQAPTKVSLPDFLRMIWQQKCSHVVMLTKLRAKGRVKCERYYPDKVGQSLKSGEVTATLLQETHKSYCVIRQLQLSHESGETRTIQQFHFTTWSDPGVPSHVDMLDFFWKVRASWTPDSGPMLVHCSAGGGRTGTFIALCILSDQAASQQRVDPLATLTALRHQRRNMIQTLGQYEFLHEVLVRVLNFGKTAVSSEVFTDHYKRFRGKTYMGMKTLDQIKEALPPLCEARKELMFQDTDDATVHENTLDYDDAAIPISSVQMAQGCVLVKLCGEGEQDTAPKGLWSFLSRIGSQTMVDVHSSQKACVSQPEEEAGEVEDGSLAVQWQAPAALASGVALRSVTVKDEAKETQVTYLSYDCKQAEPPRGLVSVVNHLCTLQLCSTPSPITFIYRNATDELTANLLCASLNMAQTVQTDREVELVNNILRVKAKFSPEMVGQCAEFAKAFLDFSDVYANT